jgi:hypothetical protein
MDAASKDNQSVSSATAVDRIVWSRQLESELVDHCMTVAKSGSSAASRDQADIYRLTAQLLKTRYPDEARELDKSSAVYFAVHDQKPRSFPDVVEAGLVTDVPRFRQLMENALAGGTSW